MPENHNFMVLKFKRQRLHFVKKCNGNRAGEKERSLSTSNQETDRKAVLSVPTPPILDHPPGYIKTARMTLLHIFDCSFLFVPFSLWGKTEKNMEQAEFPCWATWDARRLCRPLLDWKPNSSAESNSIYRWSKKSCESIIICLVLNCLFMHVVDFCFLPILSFLLLLLSCLITKIWRTLT